MSPSHTSRRRRATDGVSRREVLSAGLLLGSALGCGRLDRSLLGAMVEPDIPTGPFSAPLTSGIDPIRHALNRLSFGPRPEDHARVQALDADSAKAVEAYIEQQLHPETIDDRQTDYAVRRLETLDEPPGELFEYQPRLLLDELTRGTLLRAVYSQRQLYEVMVGFWSDHFNIDASKGDCKWLKVADDRDVIRRHALGRFTDLLRASALSPAMLWYLDGRVNRRATAQDEPNENYARELLELHTLGVHGGYSQDDVMEVARCLTGWTVRSEEKFGKGKVEFRPGLHDDGDKVVLGRPIRAGQGERDLDHVLDIVTRHPSTARYLATKLCRRFISEQPRAETIAHVASAFSAGDGDIRQTLRALFSSDEFRASATTLKLKRPFRFLVSALRATGARTDAGDKLRGFLLSMGHAPFQYPTPDGYPDEDSPWLGTLMWRWNFAVSLADGRIPGTTIDLDHLLSEVGSEGLRAHLLGRLPSAAEIASGLASEGPRHANASQMDLALTLASPAFQRY